jgi:hypothetical protein
MIEAWSRWAAAAARFSRFQKRAAALALPAGLVLIAAFAP